jgi:urea transport system permease protein
MTLVLDILTTAAIFFVVSLGLLAIFGVLKIINFAHGASLTIGAYCTVVTTQIGLNPWISLPIAFVVGGLAGGIAELLIVKPLYKRPLDAILATWGLGIVIAQFITLGFGRDVQFTSNLLSGTTSFLGFEYSA